MSAAPHEERGQPPTPTFTDVMNAFSLDSGRPSKRRRWGRRRGVDVELEDAAVATPPPPPPPPARGPSRPEPQQAAAPPPPARPPGPVDAPPPAEVDAVHPDPGPSAVRPYAWTRGRTKSGFDLAIETLVSTSPRGREQLNMLQVEHRTVAELCEQPRSVAEVAALLKIPLGVARVLLGDMAGLGVVTVHRTASSTGPEPDLALMERVLSGLRRL